MAPQVTNLIQHGAAPSQVEQSQRDSSDGSWDTKTAAVCEWGLRLSWNICDLEDFRINSYI